MPSWTASTRRSPYYTGEIAQKEAERREAEAKEQAQYERFCERGARHGGGEGTGPTGPSSLTPRTSPTCWTVWPMWTR